MPIARCSTIERMDSLLRPWEEAGDPRAVFLACYRLMTLNVLDAVRRREFQDPEWVERLVHHFAGYYFRALDDWEGDRAGTPAVWRHAFQACSRPEMPVLRQLLLGVNAHINYDLIFTLSDLLRDEWPSLGPAGRDARRADHGRVNDVIHRTADAVQDTVLEPRQPILEAVDLALGRLDEWAVARLIRRWRETVWRRSVALLEAEDPDRYDGLCSRCEAEALRRGGRILGRVAGESASTPLNGGMADVTTSQTLRPDRSSRVGPISSLRPSTSRDRTRTCRDPSRSYPPHSAREPCGASRTFRPR